MHRLDALDGEIHQHRAGKIQQSEEIEIRCQPEIVHDGGGNQPADQVARNIAGDIGRERAAGVHRTALFAEIGQRQRKGRRHAQALDNTKHREHGQVRRDGQQGGWNSEKGKAEENAEPAIDVLAQEPHDESGYRHSHRAGIDSKSHRGRGHIVMPGQRRQNGLRCKQVDDGQKGHQADDQGSQHHTRRMAVHLHSLGFHASGYIGHGAALPARIRIERKDVTPGRVGRHGGSQGVTSGNEARARALVTCCGRADPCGHRRHRE